MALQIIVPSYLLELKKKQITAALRGVGTMLKKEIQAGLNSGSFVHPKSRTKVLATSIKSSVRKGYVSVYDSAPYSTALEAGVPARNEPAYPFMTRVLDEKEAEISERLKLAIMQDLKWSETKGKR